ncbi:MAG: hypothetical protein P0120_07800 [Nitrospira sp.]|nr:hypothetical protein [Nitrospira sp.]
MKTTNSVDEFAEACEAFRSAVKIEKDLCLLEQQCIADFGLSKSQHVALQQTMRAEGGYAVEALLADPQACVKMITARQQELEAQRIQCESIARALEKTRERRKSAAVDTSMALSILRKQAMKLLEARHGKQRLFGLWNDELERTYAWRRSTLGQLLALAICDADRGCALLKCFFREKEGFGLHVRRGFFVVGEGGLREIRSTEQGDVRQVPSDLSYCEAFESVLTGRAEIVGVAN